LNEKLSWVISLQWIDDFLTVCTYLPHVLLHWADHAATVGAYLSHSIAGISCAIFVLFLLTLSAHVQPAGATLVVRSILETSSIGIALQPPPLPECLPELHSNITLHHPRNRNVKWTIKGFIMMFIRVEYAMQADSGFAHGRLFLDSGASRSLINDRQMLSNMRPLAWPRMVMGLTGPKMIKYCADLNLTMRNTLGEVKQVVIKGVYYDPHLKYNLISVSDMSKSSYATTFSNDSNKITGPEGTFELVKTSGVYALPSVDELPTVTMGAGGVHMSQEELMHLRLNHLVSYAKLETLSKSGARGIATLKCRDQKCTTCMHANITRNPAAPASTGNDAPDMSFDLVDMSKIQTLGGHRYACVFMDKGRFATVVTHKTKDELPRIVDQVLTQTPPAFKPKIIKCDGAPEHHSPAMRDVLTKHGVTELRTSNAYDQHQNGRAEKFVDGLGCMLRVMLLQSQLPPECWGAACVLACDIYNITPHSSLGMQSPYYVRHQRHPDLTFFRPFGSSMIVHHGADLVEYGKLAPRGERCVYLGIGATHGRRAFVGYSPRLNRVYATVHA
jgi:hypothetical protein